jgi:large subunit ribosomal protein L21
MYAVIKAGGKQHRVKPGDVIEVELMHGQQGTSVTFTPLLVVDDEGKTHVGKDLGKAQVKARLLGEQKGDKVKVFKYRPKTGYARHQGHRQLQTLVEIQDVVLGRRAASRKGAEEATKPQPEAEAGRSIAEDPSAGVAVEDALDETEHAEPDTAVEGSGEAGETPQEES